MKYFFAVLIAALAPSVCISCNGGASTADTPAADSTPAPIEISESESSENELSVFRHVNRVARYAAKATMDDEPMDFYIENSVHLFWPQTIKGRKPVKLQQALLDAMTATEGEYTDLDKVVEFLLQDKSSSPASEEDLSTAYHEVKSIPSNAYMNKGTTAVGLSLSSDPNDRILVARVSHEWYGGGAHGMNADDYVNYDIIEDRVLQLTDMVTDTVKLRQVITQALLEQVGAENMGELMNQGYLIGDGQVPLPSAFYCRDFNLHMVYQPYEIACYAVGSVDVEVQYYRLDDAGITTKYLQNLVDYYTR